MQTKPVYISQVEHLDFSFLSSVCCWQLYISLWSPPSCTEPYTRHVDKKVPTVTSGHSDVTGWPPGACRGSQGQILVHYRDDSSLNAVWTAHSQMALQGTVQLDHIYKIHTYSIYIYLYLYIYILYFTDKIELQSPACTDRFELRLFELFQCATTSTIIQNIT